MWTPEGGGWLFCSVHNLLGHLPCPGQSVSGQVHQLVSRVHIEPGLLTQQCRHFLNTIKRREERKQKVIFSSITQTPFFPHSPPPPLPPSLPPSLPPPSTLTHGTFLNAAGVSCPFDKSKQSDQQETSSSSKLHNLHFSAEGRREGGAREGLEGGGREGYMQPWLYMTNNETKIPTHLPVLYLMM